MDDAEKVVNMCSEGKQINKVQNRDDDQSLRLYVSVVDLCTYMIPNVSNDSQTREIHKSTQHHVVFSLVACCCNFQEREVSKRN